MEEYVLLKVLSLAAGRRKDISRIHVETLKKLFRGATGAAASLPYGLTARQTYGSLSIGKAGGKERFPTIRICGGTNLRHLQFYARNGILRRSGKHYEY